MQDRNSYIERDHVEYVDDAALLGRQQFRSLGRVPLDGHNRRAEGDRVNQAAGMTVVDQETAVVAAGGHEVLHAAAAAVRLLAPRLERNVVDVVGVAARHGPDLLAGIREGEHANVLGAAGGEPEGAGAEVRPRVPRQALHPAVVVDLLERVCRVGLWVAIFQYRLCQF